MSMDADGHQRRWLALGNDGKTSSPKPGATGKPPTGRGPSSPLTVFAEFEQRHRSIFYQGEEVLTAATQWEATWRAVGYFYSHVVPTLPAPPMN